MQGKMYDAASYIQIMDSVMHVIGPASVICLTCFEYVHYHKT